MSPLAFAATSRLARRAAGWLAQAALAPSGWGAAGRLVLLATSLALAGCAALPGQVERPVSYARSDVADTRLAQVAAASTPPGQQALSGFRLLPDGSQAIDARMALIRRAEQSIDVQYYLIAGDNTGLGLMRELRDAAARGVRVRILVDDLYATGQDPLFAGLAAHANIELRLFNPLPARKGGFAERVALSLHDFSRINRRMHNKLFVVDGAFAIGGGRNIADEYFGRSEPANFIDMDILCSGPVVAELEAVFDHYWNSVHAYPVQSLVGAGFDAAAAARAFDARVSDLAADGAPTEEDALGQSSVSSQLAGGRIDQRFADAQVLADAPSKVDTGGDDDGTGADETVSGATMVLIGAARSDVLVASPYFVPGSRGIEVMKEAMSHDVRVTVMTNSLATTDEPLVHFGYARYRSALLTMGVSLFELMPSDEHKAAETTLEAHGSLGRLHAKLAVVDGRRLFIGSMNMDRRSARWNTEVGLVIDSAEIAGDVAALLRNDRLPSSYRLRATGAGRIEWVAGSGADEVVLAKEPDAKAGRQFRLWLTSRFVREDLL